MAFLLDSAAYAPAALVGDSVRCIARPGRPFGPYLDIRASPISAPPCPQLFSYTSPPEGHRRPPEPAKTPPKCPKSRPTYGEAPLAFAEALPDSSEAPLPRAEARPEFAEGAAAMR